MTATMKPLAASEHGKTHSFSRKLRTTDEVRTYYYKLFQVYRRVGGEGSNVVEMLRTTVSMDWQVYIRLCQRLKIEQREVSHAMRAAARILESRGTLVSGKTFTAQVRAKGIDILTARSLGVPLEDYEHARANNASWAA